MGGCRASGGAHQAWDKPPERSTEAFGFRRGEGDSLQTAVLRMRPAGSGPVLVLAGTWHVGAPDYYARLGLALDGADLVLSETVRPPWDTAAGERAASPDLRLVWRYQRAVAALTGWRLQAAWERSIADERWRPLDLSWRAQADALGDGALLDAGQRARIEQLEAYARGDGPPEEIDAARSRLRVAMGREATSPVPPDWQRARDEAVFTGLREAVSDGDARRIVLLHGPAHLRAILPRVERELGYSAEAVLWIAVAGP